MFSIENCGTVDRWISAAAVVMRALYRLVIVKRELSVKEKHSVYWSNYILSLAYGHELWVVTERDHRFKWQKLAF